MAADSKLLKTKMEEYASEYPAYKAYADFLKAALTSACRRLAPFSIVEARPKSKASYAEKVVRKQEKFKDPTYQITDRCGVRVIAQTSHEREFVCDYIRRNFDVDEKNSLDVRSRLKEDEFGYLSVHYVVQIKSADTELEGVPVPPSVKTGPEGFRAEIQVRTLLEHAWANTLHDRMYKVSIRMPSPLKREAAELAATMEEADTRFSHLSQTVDAFLGSHSTYLTAKQKADEVEILRWAKHYEDSPASCAALTLRLARIARAAGQIDEAIAELGAYADVIAPCQDAIRMELGHLLCLRHRDNPLHADFVHGQELLQKVAEKQPGEREPVLPSDQVMRAEAAGALAWSYTEMRGRECDARDWYRQALEKDPDNPYHLAAFLEYEAFCRRDHSFVRIMRAAVEHAIATCRAHVAVGIEIPRAHFAMGRLRLLLGDRLARFAALNAYAKAVRVTLAPDSTVPETVFADETDFLRRIHFGNDVPPEDKPARCLLDLASALKRAKPGQPVLLPELAGPGARAIRESEKKNALIVVGGAAVMTADEVREYAPIVGAALETCDGLVFCGGTTAGIPGLVGEIAERLRRSGQKRFSLMGYISDQLPADAPRDERYDKLFRTGGDRLTELEPLQNWVDLTHAGIRPDKVRVLGINGGSIAGFEYRLGLALGAKVGVILYSGREANALLLDEEWAADPNLVRLPREILDEATLRAFVRPGDSGLSADELNELGEIAHEDYLSQNQYSDIDPVRRTWEKLSEAYRESNRQQVAYATEILRTEGYVVQEAQGEIAPPRFTTDEIERMATLEHGRWIVERLSSGWTYGRKKDPEKKISPYLCLWKDVPDYIKEFDRAAIGNYAKILAKAHRAVVKATDATA